MKAGFRKPVIKGQGSFTPPPGYEFKDGKWVQVSVTGAECNVTNDPGEGEPVQQPNDHKIHSSQTE